MPIIHVLDWTTWIYHLLQADGPDQNYLPVDRDYKELEALMKKYTKDSTLREAQIVADNAVKTFRDQYGTPAADACYWRRFIKIWRGVSFEPEVFQNISISISGVPMFESRLRDIAFEE